jgi:pimeloyl-ACP methyl ester carboxylesterase
MQITRTGRGRPLLLVHGLGSTRRAWNPILDGLAQRREVIALDLPGHNGTRAEADSGTFAGLARSLEGLLDREGLAGVDMVGSSLGGQLVLEMARRGKAGAAVALDPGGFWAGWERGYTRTSLQAATWMLRGLRPALPVLAGLAGSRTTLLAQLSARPWALDADLVAGELDAFAATATLDALTENIAFGPMQAGPADPASGPVTIGWGRHDRLCLPGQAARAAAAFPGARLHWFEHSGHFPMWDEPGETLALILEATG